MTIRVIDGTPHVYLEGVGLVPVRGASPRDAQALDQVIAFALLTGHDRTTVAGLDGASDLCRPGCQRPPWPGLRLPVPPYAGY